MRVGEGAPTGEAPQQDLPRAQVETQVTSAPQGRPKTGLLIAAFGLLAAAVAAVFLLFNPFDKPIPLPGGSPSEPAVEVGGKQVTAYVRPRLIQASSLTGEEYKPSVTPYTVDADLSNVINYDDFKYTLENNGQVKRSLVDNGFAVALDTYNAGRHSGEFFHVYEQNRYAYIPNFVTTDSMMHTYHLYFAHLLKGTERAYLSQSILEVSQAMLAESQAQLDALKGSEWEEAARRNVAFFAVASSLLDPNTQVPSEVADVVGQELDLIAGTAGIADSPLFGHQEDYSQYAPRGYYAGEEVLERYFRAMMWFGRMNFTQKDEELDRSALLITLAMQGDALGKWEAIYTVTSFFAGASDDCGYYEYRPIIDAVYGDDATVQSLVGDEKAWEAYHSLTATMPAPMINSIPIPGTEDADPNLTKGFRFMGQRFSFDETIFQALCFRSVDESASGARRLLPDALDLPAAMGSDKALSILRDNGVYDFPRYEDNMGALRSALSQLGEDVWQANLYNQWLNTLQPLLDECGEGYPAFMQSDAWARKDLVTYLGSYTELKHDTILYSKQMMAEMGGDGIETKDDRGYVEPEPTLYGRLAELTKATREGLAGYGMLSDEDASNLQLLQELAERLTTISVKELTEEHLSDDDFDLIRTYGGQLEHFWYEVYKNETDKDQFTTADFPAALVADVATDPNGSVLELGTGNPAKIFVVVNVEGSLRIATGTVFSFYQFEQPISQRLTDTTWRQMQGIELNDQGTYEEPQKTIVDWAQDFSFDPRGSF